MKDVPHNFKPPIWLRSPMMQTFVASQKFRKLGKNPVVDNAQIVDLTTPDGVTLRGSYSPHPQERGLAIILHGWEGSENSTYVLSTSRYLYGAGLSVFRLNFRDHGDTHHLNEGLFHSARLDEVLDAVVQIVGLAKGKPVYLIGFSLGGNFALRIAQRWQNDPNHDLSHIFAISPVIDPISASPKVDENALIRRYFYKKWSRSLTKKQAAFPHLYNFDDLKSINTVMGITRAFLAKYTEFSNEEDYFKAYQVKPNDLASCSLPVSIIMSQDDPVIPAEDVNELNIPENIRTIMLNYGGHNGFFQSLFGPTWYDEYIVKIANQA